MITWWWVMHVVQECMVHDALKVLQRHGQLHELIFSVQIPVFTAKSWVTSCNITSLNNHLHHSILKTLYMLFLLLVRGRSSNYKATAVRKHDMTLKHSIRKQNVNLQKNQSRPKQSYYNIDLLTFLHKVCCIFRNWNVYIN